MIRHALITNDDEGVGDEGEQHQEWHHPAIDRLHHLQGSQPGGGVNQVTAALGCTSRSKIVYLDQKHCKKLMLEL